MIEIRSFLNADLPQLADLWCIHHGVYREPPAVNAIIFQQAIASRLFFDASRLLVATDDQQPVAWCQWFPGEGGSASLTALCFHTSSVAESAVKELLHRVELQAAAAGMKDMTVGVHFQSAWGYQGLEPIGHGLGIDVADDRTNTLLEAAGYRETKRFDRWEVSPTGYRPAVSRDSLLFRRSAKVVREPTQTLSPELAAAMVHFDIERHSLVDLRSHAVIASAVLWTSDPEALVMPISDAILASWSGAEHPQGTDDAAAIRYLIGSLVLQLADRRIRSLQRTVATDNLAEVSTMIATNFARTSAGRLMSKPLRP
ncbi:MAG: hypothetical protein ACO1RT_00640 [Planctomycetaceae bacterium]